jgi:uncharacterized integral membrane protein
LSTDPQSGTQMPAPAPQPRPGPGDPRLDTPPPPQTLEPQPPSEPQAASEPQAPPPLKIKHTRTSGLWFAVGFFAVVLLFLLIFILQNSREVGISYLGAHGHLSLGVALLLSAVCGVLLTILAGAARIGQLRTVARRHRRADAKRAAR